MTFEEFLLSCAKREDGTYPYGYDVTRPMDFMCLGTTPAHLKLVWNAAINAALEELLHDDYYYDNGNKWNDDCYSSTNPKADIKKLLTS